MAVMSISDPKEAFNYFYEDAKSWHDSRSHITGSNFEIYLQEKAANKAKKYNLEHDLNQKDREKVLAKLTSEQYRKAKDGE